MPFNPDQYLAEKAAAPSAPAAFDPDAYIGEKLGAKDKPSESTASKLWGAVVAGAKKVDSYTGAPMRAGIAAAQDADSLNPVKWAQVGAEAAGKQFGANPDEAPTGEDIVKKAGVSEGIPAKVAGFGMDLAANPLNFVGMGTSAIGKAIGAAKEVPYLGSVVKAPGNLVAKGLSLISKPTEGAWATYANKTKEINDLISKHGGEIAPMADEMKTGIMNDVDQLKQGLSSDIEKTLTQKAAMEADKTTSTQPLLDHLYRQKVKLNPATEPTDIAEIQDHINTIQQLAPNGEMSVGNLYKATRYLQDNGYSTVKKGGALFYPGDAAQKAAQETSGIANQILRKEAPEIAKANDTYSQLHELQNQMGNLLKEGNAAPQLAAAGGGTGTPSQTILRKLGDLTGKDYLDEANTLYGAKAMNNPDMRTSLIRAGMTGVNATANSSIPGWMYKGTQVGTQLLNAADNSVQQDSSTSAIQRRLGSHSK